MNKEEKEIAKIGKEIEDIHKQILVTRKDEAKVTQIRQEFKAESERVMKEVYLEIKKRYMLAERDYLKIEHKL